MMEPMPAAFMSGSTAWAAKNWWRRLTAMPASHCSTAGLGQVALVVGRVVEQGEDGAGARPQGRNGRLQRRDVGDVGRLELRRMAGAHRQLGGQGLALGGGDVEKGHLAPCSTKALTRSAPMPVARR